MNWIGIVRFGDVIFRLKRCRICWRMCTSSCSWFEIDEQWTRWGWWRTVFHLVQVWWFYLIIKWVCSPIGHAEDGYIPSLYWLEIYFIAPNLFVTNVQLHSFGRHSWSLSQVHWLILRRPMCFQPNVSFDLNVTQKINGILTFSFKLDDMTYICEILQLEGVIIIVASGTTVRYISTCCPHMKACACLIKACSPEFSSSSWPPL